MGTEEQSHSKRCPPLDPHRERVEDYAPSNRPAGHDGQPPQFVTRKEFPWVEGRREATDSQFNVNHSRVCFLFTNKRIEQRQFLAAERLCRDFEAAEVLPRASSVIVGNGASGGATSGGPQQHKIDASARYDHAMLSIGRGQDIVALVVIGNKTVEWASAHLHMNRQKGWGRFDLALHILADHYGL